jgi:acetylornithine deacetylase
MNKEIPAVNKLLSSMVSYETVNGNISGKEKPEEKLVCYLEGLAGEAGFETQRLAVPDQSDDLLILYRRGADLPWVLFDSHIDTVSLEGMTIEPLSGLEKDGRIWGRGSCDTKGSGAAMLRALWEYAREAGDEAPPATAGNNIALLYSVDEEWGMTGIRTFADTHYPGLGFSVKGAIVGEPTGLRPVVAHNGVVRYSVQTRGVAVHSADPSRGKSAISDMARLVLYLEEKIASMCSASDPLTGKAQFSINVIRGGTATNIIPDHCEVQIDRRVVPGETAEAVKEDFGRAIQDFEKQYPESEITWQPSLDTPPLDSAKSANFAKTVSDVLSNIGAAAEGVGVTYATHAGDLSLRGIPSVVFGPGDIAQGHTKDEWIDTKELIRSVEVYKHLMRSL